MEVEGGANQVSQFLGSERVRIADLETAIDSTGHIEASVLLVWPFSSHHGTFSLLLAEGDAKLYSRNQVKVTFHGHVAQEVAKTRVGIGDDVFLGLRSADKVEAAERLSTPGKKLSFTLDFKSATFLEVRRGKGGLAAVNVQEPETAPSDGLATPLHVQQPLLNGEISLGHEVLHEPHLTPFLTNGIDPHHANDSVEADGYIAGKGRKRTKYARKSDAWRLVDEDEVQVLQEAEQDKTAMRNGPITPEEVPEQAASAAEKQDPTNGIEGLGVQDDVGDDVEEVVAVLEAHVHHDTPSTPLMVNAGDDAEDATLRSEYELRATEPDQTLPPLRDVQHDSPVSPKPQPSTPGDMTAHVPATASPDLQPLGPRSPSHTMPEEQNDEVAANISDSTHATVHQSEVQQNPSMRNGDDSLTGAYQVKILRPGEAHDMDQWETESGIDKQVPGGFSDGPDWQQMDELERHVPPVEITSPALFQQFEVESKDMYGPAVPPTSGDLEPFPGSADHFEEVSADISAPAYIDLVSPTVENRQDVSSDQVPYMQGYIDLISPIVENAQDTFSSEQDHRALQVISLGENRANEKASDTAWSEKLEVTAVETFYAATYDAPPFPFPQRRKDSRHSSQNSPMVFRRPSWVDGVDDVEPEKYDEHETQISDIGLTAARNDSTVQDLEDEGRTFPEQTNRLATLVDMNTDGQDITVEPLSGHDSLNPKDVVQTEQGKPEHVDDDANQDVDTQPVQREQEISEHVEGDSTLDIDIVAEHSLARQLRDGNTVVEVDFISSIEAAVTASLGESPFTKVLATPDENHIVPGPIEGVTEKALEAYLPTPRQTQEVEREVPPVQTPQARKSELVNTDDSSTMPEPRTLRSTARLNRGLSATAQGISSPYFTPRAQASTVQPVSPTEEVSAKQSGNISSSPPSGKTRLHDRVMLEDDNQVTQDRPTTKIGSQELQVLSRQDSKGTTTETSYYPSLQTLNEYYDREVDIMGIAVASSPAVQRAETGPKDYYTLLPLTDFTLGDLHEWSLAEIFRPHKNAIPKVARGDLVVLRNFKVLLRKHKPILLSTSNSAWAIIQSDGQIVMSGPPVELDKSDLEHVARFYDAWEQSEEHIPEPDLSRHMEEAIPAKQSTKKAKSSVKSTPKRTNGDDVLRSIEEEPTTEIDGTSTSFKSPRHQISRRAASVIHELRDGTKYIDNDTPPGHSVIHELRDGTNYIDEEALDQHTDGHDRSPSLSTPSGSKSTRRQSKLRRQSVIHELRDGTKYVDSSTPHRGGSVVHELRDGTTYVDEE